MAAEVTVPEVSRTARRMWAEFDCDARWTKQQAAERLEYPPRHITRLIADLREADVLVKECCEGQTKGFFILKKHQRRRIQIDALDKEARRALTVSAEAPHALLCSTPLEELNWTFHTLLAAFGDEDVFSFEPKSASWVTTSRSCRSTTLSWPQSRRHSKYPQSSLRRLRVFLPRGYQTHP